MLEFLMSTQAWFSDTYTEILLSHEHFARVNPVLPEPVRLDDIKRALRVLPAVAEVDYEKNKTVLLHLIRRWASEVREVVGPSTLRAEVSEPALHENITGLYPSRAYYHTHRGGRPTIDLYIDLAQVSLTMVSVNLATGITMDGVLQKFRDMITQRDRPVQICVSLPDPEVEHTFQTLGPALDTSPDELRRRVESSINQLSEFRQGIRHDLRGYLSIRVHRNVPSASAILIDHRTPEGRIQIETKPYKLRMQDSFGLEVRHGSPFFERLVNSYQELVNDGRQIGSD
ncbi:hypothetical protein J2S43_004325 [Catenuloplanes nepalensis]|uniref:Uncharacterized protein n=1 Tax=Catenuloplanes nepalensis TaxID=587533 RepID=A0ABT9MX42_9ACTN|nr:hypothetical protein [Catenuloplanes nepalensis]MDP9795813.1 hypothetical protein [Catenuloplanes nepalensis]